MNDFMTAQGNWETRTDAQYFGKIDTLEREAEYIDKRCEELTEKGADYDPRSAKMLEDALGDLPDLTKLAEFLERGDAIGLYNELVRIVAEYAVDAASAQAQRELGYDQ